MKHEVIVIGAGIGGLCCATKLAKQGKKVVLLEKNPHIGGTSHIFRRDGYAFPMGPLSFSHPQRVKEIFADLGIKERIDFKRNDFQLNAQHLRIVYSQPLEELKKSLVTIFPDEKGIAPFFAELKEIIDSVEDVWLWHPGYLLGKKREKTLKKKDSNLQNKIKRIDEYSRTPCIYLLEKRLKNPVLINLLGSQGTSAPKMSVLNLAMMWNVMSCVGIWFPSCGIHGLSDLMSEAFQSYGGELKTGCPVEKILIRNGRARGVVCRDGEIYEAFWIVSNADYKRTFFELIEDEAVGNVLIKSLKAIPYTPSELCVYLGVDPQKVDLKAMEAPHIFYRRFYDPNQSPGLEDFDNREVEICFWSDNAPELVPSGKAAVVLRVGFPFDHFSSFWTGEKTRIKKYKPYKEKLARSLIKTVENLLPGLGSAVEVMETATPLTYQDWGQRYRGSLAGWTWSVKNEKALGGNILVETPIPNLLMAGIYAASELFLGGVPTALHTGAMAADLILENGTRRSQ